ncbi:hypothetical protein M409DRAFT_71635 [Zasmidium cellare ATCC 36951]|uniref:Adenosine deaminase domain-containing protein n=1 Tax=Zasmidium cellare ATCC 36951 TaxID=1080233 RepID=A0A6A6BUV9_ZASCE|nr:uncharacterized protein M409DRAFT_71635 [Zasmidium cellare ATCC 36951]KAF2158475.1 hypothetical protein M409DRAFT_71635 [Zasmidium cellare ATCC 36951]
MAPSTRPCRKNGSKTVGERTTAMTRKRELLADERESAWDEPARQRASSLEVQVGEVITKLREHERFELFGNVGREELPRPDQLDMGGKFLVNKQRIERSIIFEIACLMPKGAHLHLYFNAELPAEKLFPYAQQLKNTMFIRSKRALLKPQDLAETEIQFNVLPKDTKTGNIFTENYDINWKSPENASWMKWTDFREQFPADMTFGELDSAECWAPEKMIITPNKAYAEHQTTNGVWACFNQGTRAFKGLMNYASVYRWYIGNAKCSWTSQDPADDGVGKLGHNEQMEIVCEEVEKKKQQYGDRFPFGLKIIYCTPRSIPHAKMKSELEDCIKLKLAYPDFNLYDALLLNAKRIGHGYALLKHPHLVKKYADAKIFLELCPISNELLELLAAGLHCTLNADNPALYR